MFQAACQIVVLPASRFYPEQSIQNNGPTPGASLNRDGLTDIPWIGRDITRRK
jgi:hypothetical protein